MLNVSPEYKDAIYALVRKITARMSFTIDGVTTVYDDSSIIDIRIIEEMNTINTTLPSNEIKITMDNTSGDFDFLNLANIQEVIAKRPKIEVEFGLELADASTEYIPMGVYTLIEWKNEIGSMSITLIGRDHFDMLAEISYDNTASDTLYNLAEDVLLNAGITDYSIDESLTAISTTGFPKRLDSRQALQHIGIAGKSAVYQNRNGTIIIKPFKVLDQSNNFLVFCGQANLFPGGTTYPAVENGFDMKNIVYDNIFKEPEVKLEKSIYEVVINVYVAGTTREIVYVNTSINGKNGSSFKIDNPLINSETMANEIAEWIIRESNFNAIYKTLWRQNPILECADMILVEDSFQAKKQTRIFKQEFEYRGYLRGNTESRGGI